MKPKKRTVVLDKNYLQSAPREVIRTLCARGASMPDALFFELMSNDEDRDRCFRKLPEGENPLVLLPGIGDLVRMEVRNNRPCGIPSRNPEVRRYQFNKKLADGSFVLTKEQRQIIDDQRAELRQDLDRLLMSVDAAAEMFPCLLSGRDADRRALKESIEETIATDSKSLIRFYASLELPEVDGKRFPAAERLTPNWVIFRRLQVDLLLAVDLLFRYKLSLREVMTEKLATRLENHLLDSQYVVLAAVEGGGLATADQNVRRLWRLIRAKGELIPPASPREVRVR